jgi:hypothetical protein
MAACEQKGIGVAALEQARGSRYWRARASGAAAAACERCKQDVTRPRTRAVRACARWR